MEEGDNFKMIYNKTMSPDFSQDASVLSGDHGAP